MSLQVKGVLSDAKNQLTSEILRRVEMENQVQTMKEQLDLERNISEQVRHSAGVRGGGRSRWEETQKNGLMSLCRV